MNEGAMSEDGPEPPNRKPTGQRAERKRRAIVAAAREIFVRHGYDAGMDSIADAAGVSKVTIYNHFGSKEQLFTEVISEAFEQALGDAPGQALAGLPHAGDLRETLTAIARGWVAGVTRPEVTDLRLLVIGVARRFPELARNWLERSPQRFAPVIADALRDLSRSGDLDVPDPDLAVIQFYALTVYPHIIRSMFGVPLDQRVTEDLLTSGVAMFLTYYAAKPADRGTASARPVPARPPDPEMDAASPGTAATRPAAAESP
jgi:TetR/AcrR family transcriptional repressor of mexJK operon